MELLDIRRPEGPMGKTGYPPTAQVPLLSALMALVGLHLLAMAGLGILISGHAMLGCTVFYGAEALAYIVSRGATS